MNNINTNVMGQRLSYTSVITINSLALPDAGGYTCDAKIISTRQYVLNSSSSNVSTQVNMKGTQNFMSLFNRVHYIAYVY